MIKNLYEQKGYKQTEGAIACLGKYLLIGIALSWAFNMLRNSADWGTDDSDRDGKNRSGLTVHTDYKTGVQYLSDGKGGLIRREQ